VSDLEFRRDKSDLVLNFSLPTGSYATTLISFILKDVDYLTLKDNALIIPRLF
jgi:tRNA(Glu) U13 pseudouridine synthase TruD